jgi:hypothetical protein
MAVLELYGKCKQLGYCDCGGFLGCVDLDGPGNHAPADRKSALVECEVCDRSHAPSHPHITTIEGDTLIDDAEPVQRKPAPVIHIPPPDDQLPDWLQEKEPFKQTTCELCGKIKRSNHVCKGQPDNIQAVKAEPCADCARTGELCVRHGGVWKDYDTPRVAKTLPAPVSVTQSETHNCRKGHPRTPENTYIRSDGRRECKECKRHYQTTGRPALTTEADPELAAIGTILKAVEGLGSNQLKRVMSYVAARLEETE